MEEAGAHARVEEEGCIPKPSEDEQPKESQRVGLGGQETLGSAEGPEPRPGKGERSVRQGIWWRHIKWEDENSFPGEEGSSVERNRCHRPRLAAAHGRRVGEDVAAR